MYTLDCSKIKTPDAVRLGQLVAEKYTVVFQLADPRGDVQLYTRSFLNGRDKLGIDSKLIPCISLVFPYYPEIELLHEDTLVVPVSEDLTISIG